MVSLGIAQKVFENLLNSTPYNEPELPPRVFITSSFSLEMDKFK